MTPTDAQYFDQQAAHTAEQDLSDFFGGAWNFTTNGTFSDLNNDGFAAQLGFSVSDMPQIEEEITTSLNTHAHAHAQAQEKIQLQAQAQMAPHQYISHDTRTPVEHVQQQQSHSQQAPKSKPPNLYETLKRAQMMPSGPIMMPMSPFATISDTGMMNAAGIEWSPQILTASTPIMDSNGVSNSAGLFPSSPHMVALDPNSQQYMLLQATRMKRPRVSPYLGSTGMEQAFIPASFGGMGFFPGMGMMGRPARAAKMPLSPIHKTEDPVESGEKTMPLVLPSSGPTLQQKYSQQAPPQKLVPIKMVPVQEHSAATRFNTVEKTQNPAEGSVGLEANIENNLRSFLRDTNDLEWENVTVVELKRILRQYELNATGKKAELMQRIAKIRQSYQYLGNSQMTPSRTKQKTPDANVSSPDTMGSDHFFNGNTDSTLTSNPLDSLFASALEIPAAF